MENHLKIKNLTYKKNQKTILYNVNLNLKPGRIVALLGENGTGKTTLMRRIALKLRKKFRGSLTVAGQDKGFKQQAHLPH